MATNNDAAAIPATLIPTIPQQHPLAAIVAFYYASPPNFFSPAPQVLPPLIPIATLVKPLTASVERKQRVVPKIQDTSSITNHRDIDYLSKVPPELVIYLASRFLSTQDHAVLVQVSRQFRHLVKDNYQAIVNGAIKARFPLEAAFLQCKLRNGWLVPTHSGLKSLQKEVEITCRERITGVHRFHEPGPRSKNYWKFTYKLGRAGPHFLYMLENGLIISAVRGKFIQDWNLLRGSGHLKVQKDLEDRSERWLGTTLRRTKQPILFPDTSADTDDAEPGDGDLPEPVESTESAAGDPTVEIQVESGERNEVYGISAMVLANCLQVLNCTSRDIQPVLKWYQAHRDRIVLTLTGHQIATLEAKPKNHLAWHYGVPEWFIESPKHESWAKWIGEKGDEKRGVQTLEERNLEWERAEKLPEMKMNVEVHGDGSGRDQFGRLVGGDKLFMGNSYTWYLAT